MWICWCAGRCDFRLVIKRANNSAQVVRVKSVRRFSEKVSAPRRLLRKFAISSFQAIFKAIQSHAYNRYRCAGSRSRCKSPRSQVRRDSRPNRYQPPNAETYRYQTEVLIPNLIPFAQECENERVGMIVQEHKALHMRIMLKLPFIA